MRCLFEAYEHVLSLLENVFTPMFCHSDEVRSQHMLEAPPRWFGVTSWLISIFHALISEQVLVCLCHKTKPAKCPNQSRWGIYRLPRAFLFRSLFHQPASAVSSIPGAQLTNEPTLALGQDAKPNFTPQRLFQWIQLGGPVLGHCPQQAAAPHEWCVWDIMTVFDILLSLPQNKRRSHTSPQGIKS